MVAFSPADADDFVLGVPGPRDWESRLLAPGRDRLHSPPDYWGKGLAHEALSAAIPHIFASLPINRLEADVDPRNAAAWAAPAAWLSRSPQSGATVKLGDEWCDSVYLKLMRPE